MFLHRVYSGSSLFFFNSLIFTYQTATIVLFNLFSPRNFDGKYFLRVVKAFFGQSLATKSTKGAQNSVYSLITLHLFLSHAKHRLLKFEQMHGEQNLKADFWFKKWYKVYLLSSSLSFFLLFLSPFC